MQNDHLSHDFECSYFEFPEIFKMFFALLISSFSTLPPNYQEIAVNDSRVVKVIPYLEDNLPRLFPEINFQRDIFNITEAGIQVITGYNLFVTINISDTLIVSLTLWVNNRNRIQIVNVETPQTTSNLINSYTWYDPSHFSTSQQNDVTKLIQSYRNINLKIRRVIVYRVRDYVGTHEHIIFDDSNGIVHAAVISYSPLTDSSMLEFYEAIQ
ncbi:hypothetical protein TRFO_40881 [Tritrichomonas foetus]|uniref:Uncharacterized protein n=1 Tax=Tritrichomonas foetus TaxID=1144522 RepID=A0A1J4J3R2_9EUKA|nr:hypothetical protein TRFO_40881 [Tritrichomonas foetus]|eukprot:OHS92799.1 hypothetical protein TRFO_40881 [Tritrichomonas foetus]